MDHAIYLLNPDFPPLEFAIYNSYSQTMERYHLYKFYS